MDIVTTHSDFVACKQNNTINIPDNFGKVTVEMPNGDGIDSLGVKYTSSNDTHNVTSNLSNGDKILTRAFIHRNLLPEPYRKRRD